MPGRDEDSWTSPSLILRVGRSPTDEVAWSEFVTRYGPKVLAWSLGWGLQRADAEDVTQAVMIQLSRQMGRFRYDNTGSFRGWLQTLARNAWRDWASHRHQVAAALVEKNEDALASLEARDDLLRRLEETFDLEIFAEAVDRVRGRVAEKTWTAYKLSVMENLPAREVARRLEMTEVNVFKAKSNVLKRIRGEVQILEGAVADPAGP